MCRFTERMVRSTLVTAWFLADWPTRTSPFLAKATTDGVVREPSALAMTVGSPPSRTATTEFVVPRSMPTARAICCVPLWSSGSLGSSPHRRRGLTRDRRRRGCEPDEGRAGRPARGLDLDPDTRPALEEGSGDDSRRPL